MNKIILLLCLIVFTGCKEDHGQITNDDIITQAKKCEAAGMKAVSISNGWGRVVRVDCMPCDQFNKLYNSK